MRKKTVVKSLVDIKDNFVVRITLNREHVEHLKDLIESGVEMDPLLVSADDNELIDGRHRKAAYLELGIKDASCEVRTFSSQSEKIIEALQRNVGGSLPPTHADVNHTMEILLTSGESRKSIIEMMSARIGFPPKLVSRHLDEVQSNLAKARLKKAAHAVVNDGKTVHEAATEQGVKLETLKTFLKTDAESGDDRATSVNQVKAYLSTQFRTLQGSMGQVLAKVLRELKDGILEPDEASEVMRHVNKLTARQNHHHDEWVKRFESHVGTTNKVTQMSKTSARAPQVSQANKALDRMGVLN
ncbi:MAG: ParB N-terminal domain-containing protein [Candidatus Paceibacterota bacterium]|jgi:predicted transcriptional regulator